MRLRCALLTLAVVALAAGSVRADDELKNQIFVIDDFKGLNTKQSEFSLPKEFGTLVENVRFDEDGAALAKREPISVDGDCGGTEPILGLHRLYQVDGSKVTICNHGDEIEKKEDGDANYTTILNLSTGDRRWQWITWHNIAIGTDGYNQPVKYDGSSASATYVGSLLATDAGSGAGPNGTYTYKVACYTTSYEFTLNQPSNSVTVVDNDITLTMIPICPDSYLGEDITGRRIYRIENGGSTYKLLTNGQIANNSTLTIVDSDADGALGVTMPTTYTERPPLGKHLVVHNNRLWLGNDPVNFPSRLYYGDDGSNDIFLTGKYFDIRPNDGDDITGLFNVLGRLATFKNNTIQKIYTEGDDPDTDWSIGDPVSHIGNQAPYSAVDTPVGVVYLGKSGLYRFDGQNSYLVSDAVTPTVRDISRSNYINVWGEYFKNTYYMAYTAVSTGASVNDRILIYDLAGEMFSIDTFGVNVLESFDSGTDVEALHSGSSTDGNIFSHTDTVTEIVHKVHGDFTGTFDDMRYIPEGIPGGDADDPVLEIAWTEAIDDISATIDSMSGIIDRPDTSGQYISQFLTVGADSFDKIYWNEVTPASGDTVEFRIRSGSTTPDTAAAAWSTILTDSAGSDISGVTASNFMQYRVDMTTDTITSTPNLVKRDNYVVRVTFQASTTGAETAVDLKEDTGWLDLGYPGLMKELKSVHVYYEWPADTAGTLNLTFETFTGETDVFSIDLLEYPDWYKEQFTGGAFPGELFKIKFRESSLNTIKIKKIILFFDVAPPQFYPIT